MAVHHRLRQTGFTLMEVIVACVVLTILIRFAMIKLVPPGALTLHAQAHSLADIVRRAQSLATVRRERMSVSVAQSGTNGRIALACVTGTTPCATDATLTFAQDVSLGNSGTVYFNTLGVPVDNAGTPTNADASFTLSHTLGSDTKTFTVSVAALTGRVSVSP